MLQLVAGPDVASSRLTVLIRGDEAETLEEQGS
jgi:hypothetical protein